MPKSFIKCMFLLHFCHSQGGATKKKQSRKRIIIQLPANGGQYCPEVLFQEKECDSPSVCSGYRWAQHKINVFLSVLQFYFYRSMSATLLEHLSHAFCLCERWKTHKWRRCQLVPWSIRQDSPGAQETCGPGLQARGTENTIPSHKFRI